MVVVAVDHVDAVAAAYPVNETISAVCDARGEHDTGHAFSLEATSAPTLQFGIGGVLGPAHA